MIIKQDYVMVNGVRREYNFKHYESIEEAGADIGWNELLVLVNRINKENAKIETHRKLFRP